VPVLLAIVILFCSACSSAALPASFTVGDLDAETVDLDAKLTGLKKAMTADFGGSNLYKKLDAAPADGPYTVFLSVSDSTSKAVVFHANGESIAKAFDNASYELRAYLNVNDLKPVWVKADLITSSERVIITRLADLIGKCSKRGFKWGVAFDSNYDRAFLEAQINAENMIEKTYGTFSINRVNDSLIADGKTPLTALPLNLYFFYCNGYMCDESGNVYALSANINSDYGKRVTGRITDDYAYSVIDSASRYLTGEVDENGLFVYGYNAADHSVLSGYNSVRHAGTLWNMIRDYSLTKNDDLKAAIERGIEYMLKYDYCDIDDGAALCYSNQTNVLTIGGTALSLLALAEYTRVFEDNKYIEQARALGEGIVYLHSMSESGSYVHLVEYPLLNVYKEFSIVYYDGEATLALALLYGVDENEKWINTACEALTTFYNNEYEQYSDHWIAYACNEVTKYVEKPEFYELGLKNVALAMEKEYATTTIHPTGFEMLTASFELSQRLESSGIKNSVTVPENFSASRLAEIILYRAEYNLKGFCYPEYIMYFNSPASVLGAFFIRESDFRIRIDDVQHIVGGYFNYYNLYDSLIKTAG